MDSGKKRSGIEPKHRSLSIIHKKNNLNDHFIVTGLAKMEIGLSQNCNIAKFDPAKLEGLGGTGRASDIWNLVSLISNEAAWRLWEGRLLNHLDFQSLGK